MLSGRLRSPLVFLYALVLTTTVSSSSRGSWTNSSTAGVLDYSGNPILGPSGAVEWLLGDPTLVEIDGTLHLFANEIFHSILHYTAPADDPLNFSKVGQVVLEPGASRAYAYYEPATRTVSLFYEQYLVSCLYSCSGLMLKQAVVPKDLGSDVWTWTSPKLVLQPELDWEKVGTARIGNPMIFLDTLSRKFTMFYSASSVHLDDANIDEPLHLGLAQADDITGPWTRATQTPLKLYGGGHTYIGVGALRLVKGLGVPGSCAQGSEACLADNEPGSQPNQGPVLALCNRITQDPVTNATGSTIDLLTSSDLLSWTVVQTDFIAPTPTAFPPTWKQAYIYAHDTIADPTDDAYVLAFYNARDGWAHAKETVGVSRIDKKILPFTALN